MIDGTEKPKIPSKFSKRAARYNEFRCNLAFCSSAYMMIISESGLFCKVSVETVETAGGRQFVVLTIKS